MPSENFLKNLTEPLKWGERVYTTDDFNYPDKFNAAVELLKVGLGIDNGEKVAIHFGDKTFNYNQVEAESNRWGNFFKKLGVKPEDRVIFRMLNNPDYVFMWLGLLKVGGVAVATMPLLRAKELVYIADDSEARFVITSENLLKEVKNCKGKIPTVERICSIGNTEEFAFEDELNACSTELDFHLTKRDDVALIGYTSGSTGNSKGTVHFHEDVLVIADGYAKNILKPTPKDVFGGHPTLAFTFGLGALLVFPFRFGASTVLLEKFTPEVMLDLLQNYGVTISFCAPTAYNAMMKLNVDSPHDLSKLRIGVSAGETLPAVTFDSFKRVFGVELLDGIGATEMLHIFITNYPGAAKPGSTGKVVPGYKAKVVNENFEEQPAGEPGVLLVKGPTGCRYWKKPERQAGYVHDGWNTPGDIFSQDEEGYFYYHCRNDDLIISSGYNIAGPEVENSLLAHDAVKESGVIGKPDKNRGQIVKAYVVLNEGFSPSEEMVLELQEQVKNYLAPYKYPREIEFVSELPRTETGKVKRFILRKKSTE